MRVGRLRWLGFLLLVACEDPIPPDAGLPDATPSDGGATVVDAGAEDAGLPAPDAGQDAGVLDAASGDAAPGDATAGDAAPFPVRIAYGVTAEDPLVLELYLTETSTARRRLSGPMAGGRAGGKKEPETGGLQSFEWSGDGRWLLYLAQQDTYDQTDLYVADVAGRAGAPRRIGAEGGRDVSEPSQSPVSGRIAFTQHTDRLGLFVASATAADPAPRRVNQGTVVRRSWSPAADQLVFHDLIQSANDRDLWFTEAHPGAAPPVRVNPGANLGFGGALAWAPDGSSFVYAADERALRLFELYWVRVDQGMLGPRVRIHPPFPAAADIAIDVEVAAAFSPDGSLLAYVADPRFPPEDELFVVDLGGATPGVPLVVSSTVGGTGVQRFAFDGAGGRLIYATRGEAWADRPLFLADPRGLAAPMRLSPPDTWVVKEAWGLQDTLVVFEALGGVFYGVDLTQDPPQTVRLTDLPVGTEVVSWELSPDGRWLLYAVRDIEETSELHGLDLADPSARPVRLSRSRVEPAWCWAEDGSGALAITAELSPGEGGRLWWISDLSTRRFVDLGAPVVPGGVVRGCAFAPDLPDRGD